MQFTDKMILPISIVLALVFIAMQRIFNIPWKIDNTITVLFLLGCMRQYLIHQIHRRLGKLEKSCMELRGLYARELAQQHKPWRYLFTDEELTTVDITTWVVDKPDYPVIVEV
jgi:hypothetical protein